MTGRLSTATFRSPLKNVEDETQLQGRSYEMEDDDMEPLIPHRSALAELYTNGASTGEVKGYVPCVDAYWFRLLTAAVIFANVAVISAAVVDVDLRSSLKEVDKLFLGVYFVELILRICHLRMRFFCELPEALWNWMDTGIVIAGTVDSWVLPALHVTRSSGAVYVMLRGLRVFRLLRIVRLLRMIWTTDFKWTESAWFQTLVGVVIALNAVIMGLETDYDSKIWSAVEQVLLAFYVAELAFRIRQQGSRFIFNPDERWWNLLDVVIVISGVVDMWFESIWQAITKDDDASNDSGVGKMMMLLRLLRLMRILRLVRVVKAIRPLNDLAIAILRSLTSMFWVLVLTFVGLYALAIVTTRMIGQGQLFGDVNDIPDDARKMFGTIQDSMFTLFAVMNKQGWEQFQSLLESSPITKPIFVIFTIYSSWALLSVMTGVVSDHMRSVREEQQQLDEEAQEERRERLRKDLLQIFAAADREGTGSLNREDCLEILRSPYHVKRLQRAVHQPVGDVQRLLDWLDIEERGSVDFEEFCECLDWLSEQVTGRLLVKMDSGVKLVCSVSHKRLLSLAGATENLGATIRSEHDMFMDAMTHTFNLRQQCIPDRVWEPQLSTFSEESGGSVSAQSPAWGSVSKTPTFA